MKLEVEKDEIALLHEMIHKELMSLPVEIHHCRTVDFKAHLKKKLEIVEKLMEKVKVFE